MKDILKNLSSTKREIDIVTIVCDRDLPLLKIQLESFYKHVAEECFHEYVIIVNGNDLLKKYISNVICGYHNKIRVLTAIEIANNDNIAQVDGYISQQILKLLYSRRTEANNYLVLDAKNHFIRSYGFDDIYNSNKLISAKEYLGGGYLRNCFIRSARVLECDEPRQDSDFIIIPTVTPYLINSSCCRGLIEYIENKYQNNFVDIFSKNLNNCTEFYLYYNWIKKCNKINELYEFKPKKYVTLFSRFPQDHNVCKDLLMKTIVSDIKIFGLHGARIEQLDNIEKMMILDIYDRAGLGEQIRELLSIYCL